MTGRDVKLVAIGYIYREQQKFKGLVWESEGILKMRIEAPGRPEADKRVVATSYIATTYQYNLLDLRVYSPQPHSFFCLYMYSSNLHSSCLPIFPANTCTNPCHDIGHATICGAKAQRSLVEV